MENSKRIISPSSPISGNNENESENQRNSLRNKNNHCKSPTSSPKKNFYKMDDSGNIENPRNSQGKKQQHYFMSPNSKTPRKNILKPPIKSFSQEKSDSMKYFSKNPPFSLSPKSNLVQFDDHNVNEFEDDGDTIVAESCTLPYDPFTNYLSPRPKFLRYNPNRKRKSLIVRVERSESCLTSPESSLDSLNPSTEESIGNEKSLSDENSLNNEEDLEDQEDDDEMIEEENGGLKWVFLKGLSVFFVLVFSTMYITSMNNPGSYPVSRRFGYESMSFMPFSLRNLELGFVKEKLKKGLSEIKQLGFDGKVGGLVEAPEFDYGEGVMGFSDCVLEETEVEINPQVSDGVTGGLVEAPVIEVGDESMGGFDCVLEETETGISLQVSEGAIGGLAEALGIEVGGESMGGFVCVLEETEMAMSPQVSDGVIGGLVEGPEMEVGNESVGVLGETEVILQISLSEEEICDEDFPDEIDYQELERVRASYESMAGFDCVLEESEMAMSSQTSDGVNGGLVERPETEVGNESVGVLGETEVIPQISLSEEELCVGDFHDEIDYQELEMVRASYDFNSEAELYYEGFSDPMVGNFIGVEAENKAPMDTVDPSLATEGYGLGDIEYKMDDFDLRLEGGKLANEVELGYNLGDIGYTMDDLDLRLEAGKLANEVEFVAGDSYDDIEHETMEEVLDLEPIHMHGDVDYEIDFICDGSFNGNEQENEGDYEYEMADSEPKSKDLQSENGADIQIDGDYEGSIAENGDTNVRKITLQDFAWLVPSAVISFVACLVAKFYYMRKKVSLKTTTSKKKLNSEVEKVEVNRLTELHPEIGESFEPIHPTADPQVNLPSSSVVPESCEEIVKTPPRIISKVKQLGEIDFGRAFNFKNTDARSENPAEREASVCVVTDERKTKRSKVSSSDSSKISVGKTVKQEQRSREEMGAIRRSMRLRSRGVTSP